MVSEKNVDKGRWLLTIGLCIGGVLFCLYGLSKVATWAELPSVANNQMNYLVFVVLLGILAALGLLLFVIQILVLLGLAFKVEIQGEQIVVHRLLGAVFITHLDRFSRAVRMPLLDLTTSSNVVFCHVLFFGLRWFAVVDRGETATSLLQALKR